MFKVISSFYQLFCGFQQAAERSFQKATRRAEIYLKTLKIIFSHKHACIYLLAFRAQ